MQPYRVGIPGVGGQTEPYYDVNLFYPEDYFSIEQGSVIVDAVYGERRIDPSVARNPYLRAALPYLTALVTNPTLQRRGGRNYNTSKANAQHYAHYVGQGSAVSLSVQDWDGMGCMHSYGSKESNLTHTPNIHTPHNRKMTTNSRLRYFSLFSLISFLFLLLLSPLSSRDSVRRKI